MEITPSSNASSVLIGGNGATIISDTAVHTGPFYALKAISECVVSSIAFSSNISGSLNGLTILAGDTIILFRMETIQLTSGNAIAYKQDDGY